jgi:hypothetical protein
VFLIVHLAALSWLWVLLHTHLRWWRLKTIVYMSLSFSYLVPTVEHRAPFWGFLILFRPAVGLVFDERLAHLKGLYLYRTTQHRNTNIHVSRGIRNHDPKNQVAKTYALDRAVTGTGNTTIRLHTILQER